MIRSYMLMPIFLMLVVPFLMLGLLQFSKWRRDRKGVRPPFSDRLLRSPGDSLRRQIQDMGDDATTYMIVAGIFPMTTYASYLSLISSVGPEKGSPLLFWIVGIGFTLILIWKTMRLIGRRRLLRLGLAGEMAAGEELNRLMLDGYHVYHDFPADRFNIDHILVGRTGVFAVETKARSKKSSRTRKAEAEVVYDGGCLRFPSFVTTEPLDQAKSQAKWMAKWLSKAVGETLRVEPMVTIPGWYVNRMTGQGVPVLNPKEVRSYVAARKEALLSDSVIQRICHQLEQKCRDVELF